MRDLLHDEVETRDWTAYREASERLERYRLGDFEKLDDAVSESFEATGPGDFNLVPVEVVAGACRDVGRLYDMPPGRAFGMPREEQRQRVAAFYALNDLDAVFGQVDQAVHAQNVVVLGFDPAGPGRVRPVVWAPWEVKAVEFDDLLELDLRRAKRVELRVPVSVAGDSVVYGTRVYTETEAYTMAPDGKTRVGVFDDDGTNPFGFIPLVARREAPPAAKGEWFPPINEALLKLQEQVAISVSDILRTARYQCHIRRVLTGGTGTAPQVLKDGADEMLYLPDSGDGESRMSYSEHSAAPPTAEYWETLREMLTAYERFAGLTPGALTQSTGITGAAKQVEQDTVERRVRERKGRAARFEQDVLELLLATNAIPLVSAEAPMVRVEYHLPRPKGNALQDAQARAVAYANGTGSPVEDVMAERGVSRAEAERMVEQNLADRERFGPDIGAAVQGMDKTARPAV